MFCMVEISKTPSGLKEIEERRKIFQEEMEFQLRGRENQKEERERGSWCVRKNERREEKALFLL